MLRILCCNEKCTAPGRLFQWDDHKNLQAGGKLAKKGDDGAVSFVETCPFCGSRNKFYVTKVQKIDVTRNMI
ncbi:MAG: hypothetical protein PHS80_10250 [Methanothrix sp.]|nr:hypothetical protein [Methanothrix sp.]MDD4447633.1 hypothetical protein [Methanothrix sp.]